MVHLPISKCMEGLDVSGRGSKTNVSDCTVTQTGTPGSERFKIRDASSYDLVTEQFERFSNRLSTPLAETMVSLSGLAPAQRVLDVATGTGLVALIAARKVHPNGKVIGIDLSEGMLARAKAKASSSDVSSSVEFRRMDAEALQFKDCAFDRVLSLFALLHFPNPLKALCEMFRVLQPDGRLVIAVGSGPPLISFRGIAHRVERLPDLVLKFRGKRLVAPGFLDELARRYFPEATDQEESSFASQHRNRSRHLPLLVKQAGFSNITTYWKGHQAIVDSADEFWEMQRTFSSVGRKRLSNASPEMIQRLRDEFISICRDVKSRGGRLVYPFAAFYVTAIRPQV